MENGRNSKAKWSLPKSVIPYALRKEQLLRWKRERDELLKLKGKLPTVLPETDNVEELHPPHDEGDYFPALQGEAFDEVEEVARAQAEDGPTLAPQTEAFNEVDPTQAEDGPILTPQTETSDEVEQVVLTQAEDGPTLAPQTEAFNEADPTQAEDGPILTPQTETSDEIEQVILTQAEDGPTLASQTEAFNEVNEADPTQAEDGPILTPQTETSDEVELVVLTQAEDGPTLASQTEAFNEVVPAQVEDGQILALQTETKDDGDNLIPPPLKEEAPQIPICTVEVGDRPIPKLKKPKGMLLDAVYREYNRKFVHDSSELLDYAQKWIQVLGENKGVIPEDYVGDIESSVGQAKLLLESKLPQFAELLYFYLSKTLNPHPVLACDLEGWWAVAEISIYKVKDRFLKLEKLATNGWSHAK